MSDEIVFDTLPSGGWLRARDFVGHWCLFVVKNKQQRAGTFGDETVVTCDFADLDSPAPEIQPDVNISDPHVVSKLRPGAKIVARVVQGEAKRAGFNGPLFIEQPEGPQYDQALATAKDLLLNGRAPKTIEQAKENLRELFQ